MNKLEIFPCSRSENNAEVLPIHKISKDELTTIKLLVIIMAGFWVVSVLTGLMGVPDIMSDLLFICTKSLEIVIWLRFVCLLTKFSATDRISYPLRRMCRFYVISLIIFTTFIFFNQVPLLLMILFFVFVITVWVFFVIAGVRMLKVKSDTLGFKLLGNTIIYSTTLYLISLIISSASEEWMEFSAGWIIILNCFLVFLPLLPFAALVIAVNRYAEIKT